MNDDAFDADRWIEQLSQAHRWLPALFEATDPDHWRAHPSPGKWSLLEILAHLVDEEREDFRPRLLSTLEDPDQPWKPIDPEGWVSEREYASKNPRELLEDWKSERKASVDRLREVVQPEWSRAHAHPSLGPLSAGDLLCAWIAHDHLHARQIMRTRWQLLESATASFSARYAMP